MGENAFKRLGMLSAIALSAADRGYVLETGEIVLSDSSEKLSNNPQVKKAYLGGT